jgi:hypothetical protein
MNKTKAGKKQGGRIGKNRGEIPAAPGWIIRHRLYSGFRRKREPFCRVGVVHGQVRGGEVCWVRKTYGKELLLLPTWGTRRMSRVQLDLLVLLAGCCM